MQKGLATYLDRCYTHNIMKKAINGYEAVATRMHNAEVAFADTLRVTVPTLTDAEASKVLALYIDYKLVKLDAVMGVYNAKTGLIFDADVIGRALQS